MVFFRKIIIFALRINPKRHEKNTIHILAPCAASAGRLQRPTLTVTSQLTGEQWSVDNSLVLKTSTASGTYWVQIETEDGSSASLNR